MIADALTWQTRLYFAMIAQECIEGAMRGDFHVNDLADYIAWQNEAIRSGMAGEADHTFTFRQHRHYLATGECVPLLP